MVLISSIGNFVPNSVALNCFRGLRRAEQFQGHEKVLESIITLVWSH